MYMFDGKNVVIDDEARKSIRDAQENPWALDLFGNNKTQGGSPKAFANRASAAAAEQKAKADADRAQMLDLIEKMRASQMNPISTLVQSSVQNQLQNPSNVYRSALQSQLDRNVGMLNKQAATGQANVNANMAARGLGNSGMVKAGYDQIDANRQDRIAGLAGQTQLAMADRAAGDNRAAISQGMNYLNQQNGMGNSYLSQMSSVLGNTSYPIPNFSAGINNPGTEAQGQMSQQLQQMLEQSSGNVNSVPTAPKPYTFAGVETDKPTAVAYSNYQNAGGTLSFAEWLDAGMPDAEQTQSEMISEDYAGQQDVQHWA